MLFFPLSESDKAPEYITRVLIGAMKKVPNMIDTTIDGQNKYQMNICSIKKIINEYVNEDLMQNLYRLNLNSVWSKY